MAVKDEVLYCIIRRACRSLINVKKNNGFPIESFWKEYRQARTLEGAVKLLRDVS